MNIVFNKRRERQELLDKIIQRLLKEKERKISMTESMKSRRYYSLYIPIGTYVTILNS